MSSNLHPKRPPSDKDLRRNPGIGSARGTIKGGDILDDENPDRGNTFEGDDIENDTTAQGGIDPRQTGGTNQ